jgi:hypothetical protein
MYFEGSNFLKSSAASFHNSLICSCNHSLVGFPRQTPVQSSTNNTFKHNSYQLNWCDALLSYGSGLNYIVGGVSWMWVLLNEYCFRQYSLASKASSVSTLGAIYYDLQCNWTFILKILPELKMKLLRTLLGQEIRTGDMRKVHNEELPKFQG